MTEDRVLYTRDGPVVTLTLNRPDEINAFSDKPMIEAFLAALDRLANDHDARCAILTGEPADAETALADTIAANALLALKRAKRLLRAAPQQSLAEHLKACAEAQAYLHGTEDHMEAISALLEKREPTFRGR